MYSSFGHVFLVDTGTSNGDIMGQSKAVNSCDFRPTRPFRIVTGSEDNSVAVYEGENFENCEHSSTRHVPNKKSFMDRRPSVQI